MRAEHNSQLGDIDRNQAESAAALDAISLQIDGNGETLQQISAEVERLGNDLAAQSSLLGVTRTQRASAVELLGQLVTGGQAHNTAPEVTNPTALGGSEPRLPGCCPDWAAGNCAGVTCPHNLLHVCSVCSTADEHVVHQWDVCPKRGT